MNLSNEPEIERIEAMLSRVQPDSPIVIHLCKLMSQLKAAELRRQLVTSEVLSKASLRSCARASAELLIKALKDAGVEGNQRQAIAESFWQGFAKIVDGMMNSTEPATARLRGPVR